MKNKIFSLGIDSIKYGLVPVARRFIGLFLVPIYTRKLSPSDYGTASIIATASSLITRLLTWGMSGAFFRYYHECNQEEKIALVSTIQNFRLVSGLIFCVGFSIFSKHISNVLLYDSKYYNLILLSLFSVLLSTLSNLVFDVLRADFKIIQYNFIQIGGFVSQVLLSIIFIVILNYGVYGIFLANLVDELIICLVGLFLIRNLFSFKIDSNVLKKSLSFGIGFLPSEFSAWIVSVSDRIFLTRFVSLSDIGIYSISNQLSNILQFFTGAFRQAWVPIAYRDYRKDEAPVFFKKTSIYYAIILSMAILACSIFSLDALKILTTMAYHRSYFYVPMLAFGIAFNGLSSMIAEGLNFAKKPFYRSVVLIIGALTNFSLNFYFIPQFGIFGASITTALAYFVSLIFAFIFAKKFYARIKYNFGKILLILGYSIPFIVINILLLDSKYSVYNIIFKIAIFLTFIISIIYIFSKNDMKSIINNIKLKYVYKASKI